ncbi:MAG: hypothetical protein WCV90_00570 [Candidatus Woesearchaeota archaeon]
MPKKVLIAGEPCYEGLAEALNSPEMEVKYVSTIGEVLTEREKGPIDTYVINTTINPNGSTLVHPDYRDRNLNALYRALPLVELLGKDSPRPRIIVTELYTREDLTIRMEEVYKKAGADMYLAEVLFAKTLRELI